MNITPETQAMAQRVLDYIHANPEKHDQAHFFAQYDDEGNPLHCGTTMCIAGTAIFLEYGVGSYDQFKANPELSPDGTAFGHLEDVAGELLGLNMQERFELFYTMDNEDAIQMLKTIVVGDEFGFRHIYNQNRGIEND